MRWVPPPAIDSPGFWSCCDSHSALPTVPSVGLSVLYQWRLYAAAARRDGRHEDLRHALSMLVCLRARIDRSLLLLHRQQEEQQRKEGEGGQQPEGVVLLPLPPGLRSVGEAGPR